jgi:hypothetical protein
MKVNYTGEETIKFKTEQYDCLNIKKIVNLLLRYLNAFYDRMVY